METRKESRMLFFIFWHQKKISDTIFPPYRVSDGLDGTQNRTFGYHYLESGITEWAEIFLHDTSQTRNPGFGYPIRQSNSVEKQLKLLRKLYKTKNLRIIHVQKYVLSWTVKKTTRQKFRLAKKKILSPAPPCHHRITWAICALARLQLHLAWQI